MLPSFSVFKPIRRFAGRKNAGGFSLVEAIFTTAIIGIMSAIVVAAISNVSRDSYRVVARQQQAALQSAVTSWVMAQMRVTSGSTAGQYRSLESVRSTYNSQGTSRARLSLLVPNSSATDTLLKAGFLDQTTADHFLQYTTSSDRLLTQALDNAGSYLTLPTWESGDFPRVIMVDQ